MEINRQVDCMSVMFEVSCACSHKQHVTCGLTLRVRFRGLGPCSTLCYVMFHCSWRRDVESKLYVCKHAVCRSRGAVQKEKETTPQVWM